MRVLGELDNLKNFDVWTWFLNNSRPCSLTFSDFFLKARFDRRNFIGQVGAARAHNG